MRLYERKGQVIEIERRLDARPVPWIVQPAWLSKAVDSIPQRELWLAVYLDIPEQISRVFVVLGEEGRTPSGEAIVDAQQLRVAFLRRILHSVVG
jgi:hypothetical protein